MTDAEIAKRSGLDAPFVYWLSWETDWGLIPLGDMQRFLIGCGMDFCDRSAMKRVDVYLRGKPGSRPTFRYLKKSPLWTTFYLPLMKRYQESVRMALQSNSRRNSSEKSRSSKDPDEENPCG